jgi:hypothetical protein
MQVTFTKVDAKRYLVAIEREHGPGLVPRFAPGYDDLMPHDLAHYLVEEEFEIELGVFGQLAAGGSGIFMPAPEDNTGRFRRSARRIAAVGRTDIAHSERLVVVSMLEWEASIGRRRPKTRQHVDGVEPAALDAAVRRLSDAAGTWRSLQYGRSLTFEWPRRLTFDAAKSHRGRRQPQSKATGQRAPASARR